MKVANTARLGIVVAGLAAATGCIQFDDLFFPAERVDAYSLTYDIIPSNLVQEVVFETEDGQHLYGIWARQEIPSPPLVFFHGNAGNIDDYWGRVEYYWNWNTHDVFIFDYRGYGKSEGTPEHDGIFGLDGFAATEYVATTSPYPDEQLWVGLSLGGGVAIHTAERSTPRAIVAEATYATADDIIEDSLNLDLPAGWFFEDPFDNVTAIANITSPILIIHGADDDYIHPDSGQQLFDAAPDPKELWQPLGVGHNDIIEVMPADYRGKIAEWYDAQGSPGSP